jgi:hypothetical protein
VPEGRVWEVLPAVNRQAVVGQLARLVSRVLSIAASTGEPGRR